MAPIIITRAQARAQGLKRYFTGEACKRGHVAERQVSNLTCMECTCEKQRHRWPTLDKAKQREIRGRWREANRERVNAASRAANATAERKAYKATWFQANKARVLEQRRTNPNSSKSNVASAKRWAEANPEKAREYSRMNRRRRRAKAKEAGGTHTAADLADIFASQNGRCVYCRADLRKIARHVDHIMPLALGGSNGPENLQYLCQPCNQSKGAKHPDSFARERDLVL